MPTNPPYTVSAYEEARRIVNKRAAASGDAYSLDLQLAKNIADLLARSLGLDWPSKGFNYETV